MKILIVRNKDDKTVSEHGSFKEAVATLDAMKSLPCHFASIRPTDGPGEEHEYTRMIEPGRYVWVREICTVCGGPTRTRYADACTDSACNEAAYYRSKMRACRKGSEARGFAKDNYEHAVEMATVCEICGPSCDGHAAYEGGGN